MILFMWQDDIIGVARFMDACLERVYTSAGPYVRTRHLISPELAKDVMSCHLLLQAQMQGMAASEGPPLADVEVSQMTFHPAGQALAAPPDRVI